MKTCVLHFGMAKTGSTSIQATLSQLPPRPDVVYLQSGEANAGRALSAAFMDDAGRFRPNRKLGLDERALARRRRRALASFEQALDGPVTLAVLSSEMLANFDRDSLVALRDWLAPRVDRIRLLGYVREPAAFMESMSQQALKNGNDRIDLQRRYPAYRQRFEPFESVFGRDAVTYRRFDPAGFPGGCVVRDFCATIGLDLPESAIVRVNEGLSRRAVGLLLAYRQAYPEFGSGREALRRNRALVALLTQLPGDKLRLDPALLRPVIEAQADDLAWINERLDRPLQVRYAEAGTPVLRDWAELAVLEAPTLAWLAELTGTPVPGGDAAQVAAAAARLLRQHLDATMGAPATASAAPPNPPPPPPAAPEQLDTAQLLAWARAAHPDLPLDDAALTEQLQQGLAQLARRIAAADEPLQVAGLGEFLPRGGAAGAQRRIVWRAAEAPGTAP